jgi:ribonuclease G
LSSEILISSDPWENRVAIIEDGELAELYIEREEKVIGSIFKGKVQNVLPGMGAAFVDIGLGRNAFLYVDDISKQPLNIGDVEITRKRSGFTITDKIKKNDDVLVQIVKEPRGLKGARISTNISLPGRYLILMPAGRFSGVSRKIESASERDRLKAIMQRIRPEGMATVIRTAATGVSEAELIADLGVLIRMWHGILETYKRAESPALLHKDMNLVYKAARDFVTADVDRVLIDNEDEYRRVRDFLQLLGPQYIDRLEYYKAGRALFDDYRVNEELTKLMRPKINLPSGGSIVIESTEALTVIDVNSGKFTGGKNLEDTIVKTNIEAAAEVARQVRLRDIGGIIVVDFIDMSSEGARNKVVDTLEEGLHRDRTRSTIQSFSNLGLLEFTRKRIGKDLGAQLRGPCPTCSGLGSVLSPQSVAIETLRHVRDSAKHQQNGKTGELIVHAAPTVASQLDFWYEDECAQLARDLEIPIHVRVDATLHPEKSRVERGTLSLTDKSELVRVGDEHSVELLAGRLPNALSAAAVVNGHIVEVENAANNAGNSARIRIIDVDDTHDHILSELISAGAPAEKKRRRRGGSGRRAPLTPAEQAAQLRELAKEAADQVETRVPIGITTVTEEEEAHDKVHVAETLAARKQTPGQNVTRARDFGIREPERAQDGESAASGEGGIGRRRRRRRRGRGRGGVESVTQVGISAQSADTQRNLPQHLEEEYQEGDDRQPHANDRQPHGDSQSNREGGDGHKRRRRRRRGSGGPLSEQLQQSATGDSTTPDRSVPDRHIFAVGADGGAEATGKTAPREPSRALTLRRAHPPAVDAPPPSLKAAQDKPKPTKPTSGRRPIERVTRPVELESTPIPALPAGSKLKRAKSKVAAVAETPREPSAKKTTTKKTSGRKASTTRKKTSTAPTRKKKK